MQVRVAVLLLTSALIVPFLTSCSQAKVDEMNQRIDQLEITSDEIMIRAASMNELELVVSAMEERQAERLKEVKEREANAKARVEEIQAELWTMEKKIKELEDDTSRQRLNTQDRLAKLMEDLDKTVDLKPKPGEEKVVLIERLVKMISILREENERLRGHLEKQ
ncbi:MAG: hypothetical protein P1V20_23080 [Verrucomicrobiales bacterium]|nr:hypothetical protein [Verrucomicrobiales bacterium]